VKNLLIPFVLLFSLPGFGQDSCYFQAPSDSIVLPKGYLVYFLCCFKDSATMAMYEDSASRTPKNNHSIFLLTEESTGADLTNSFFLEYNSKKPYAIFKVNNRTDSLRIDIPKTDCIKFMYIYLDGGLFYHIYSKPLMLE
jgi:hypothetical protein